YGFATEWAVLPAEKLGVIVVCSRDVANPVVNRITADAFRLMLAAKAGKPLPKLDRSRPLPPEEARFRVGRYRAGERRRDRPASVGRLYVTPDRGGARFRVRATNEGLISDDVHAWGVRYAVEADTLVRGDLTFKKEKPSAEPPPEPLAKWRGLIG